MNEFVGVLDALKDDLNMPLAITRMTSISKRIMHEEDSTERSRLQGELRRAMKLMGFGSARPRPLVPPGTLPRSRRHAINRNAPNLVLAHRRYNQRRGTIAAEAYLRLCRGEAVTLVDMYPEEGEPT